MEAISGCKALQEIAPDHAVHPIQVSPLTKLLQEGASDLFTRRHKKQVPADRQAPDGAGLADEESQLL